MRALRPSSSGSRLWLDLTGVVLVGAFMAWVALASGKRSGAHPANEELLAVACVAAYVAGRSVGWIAPVAGSLLLAVGIAVASAAPSRALSGGALAPPLHYGNADGALLAQGVAAVALGSVAMRRRSARVGGALLAVAVTVETAFTRSAAALALAVVIVGVLAVTAVLPRLGGRVIVVGGACALLLVVGTTIGLGAAYDDGSHGSVVKLGEHAFTERRLALWHDALNITRSHPATGVGADRFQVTSPTALGDRDARWAHEEYLQASAETGVVGGLLLLAIAVWGFAALWRSPQRAGVIAVGAAGWLAVTAHAAVDYVGHYPAVVLSAVSLLGVATAQVRAQNNSTSPRLSRHASSGGGTVSASARQTNRGP